MVKLIKMFILIFIISLYSCESIDDLLKKYDKNKSPDKNVDISINFFLRQLVSLDEKNQQMVSNIYIGVEWSDDRLIWNATDQDLTEREMIKASRLWMPDLAILNSADGDYFLKITDSNFASVSSNGNVYLLLSINSLRTRCSMNVYKFPFDKQNCSIGIGSWALSTDDVTFKDNVVISINDFDNSVWKLQNITYSSIYSTERLRGSSVNELNSEDVYINLLLKRRPLYFMMNSIFPSLVLNVITILSYILPFSSQVSLTMTIILTSSVYSLRVASDIPVQSEYLPLATIYFIMSMLYSLFSLLWFSSANFFITRNKIPKVLEFISLKLMCITKTENSNIKNNEVEPVTDIVVDKKENNNSYIVDDKNSKNDDNKNQESTEMKIKSTETDENENNKVSLTPEEIKAKKDEEEKNKKKHVEKCVKVLNYIFLFFMFIFILATNLTIWLCITI